MDGKRGRVNPDVIRDVAYKPTSVPTQPFRLRHRVKFISEGARSSKRNKRPTSGQRRPRRTTTLPSPNSYPYSGPPAQFEVTAGLRDAIPLASGESSFWAAEHAAFIKSPAGLDSRNWIGMRPLGSGSFGTAGLWELRDENNVVIEQIVIKESKTITVERWNGVLPEEVKMMRRINNTGCQAVPKLIAYKRYMGVRKHRIYMEFCPYSDLTTLSLNYKRFSNLVKVAAAMRCEPNDISWGYQIVHRDLKPANIFLGLEDGESGFPSYPVAKTGDWGLATKVEPNDPANPLRIRGAGTEAYFAPEQRVPRQGDAFRAQVRRHLDGTAPLPRLSAHTNVWGIGAIMFELLTHEAVVTYLNDDEWTVNGAFIDIPNVRNPRYSGALTELIRLCLEPEPWDRPSIEELELKIETKCQSIVSEYAANPNQQERDRLYYKGSEINQMPPGDWNYWYPAMEYVPRPSEAPDRRRDPRNPFTNTIIYPPFPTSELDGLEEEGEEAQDDTDDENDDKDRDDDVEKQGHETPKGAKVDGAGELVAADPPAGPKGNDVDPPLLTPDSDRGNDADHPFIIYEDQRSSEVGSDDSVDSNDSDVKRRRAIKKLPGT